ncbi:DUF6335 family protein [Chamaesiphon minutus]|uniref:Uncharacterized protein n=1 Tax=Chamaesiphon minutus (strain ATCC 27169 / PCC 6605) TaxID=1173020 RepID=K9UPB3_CHAP6|nr:DUF6335 family protein [Chamaesiphon minutus]AFY96523.1 hypothetical protein Cha6605_5659 [Chamaesiphon minutus PCC 6605]
MNNRVDEQQDRELSESATVTSVDPDRLNQVSVIDPPIWEEIAVGGASPLENRTDDDLDTEPDLAEEIGVESIGDAVTTPDWNDVEDLAVSVGIGIPDRELLHTNEMLEDRDTNRWELNPLSAEDFKK